MPREMSPAVQVTYLLDAQLRVFVKTLQVRSHHDRLKGRQKIIRWLEFAVMNIALNLIARTSRSFLWGQELTTKQSKIQIPSKAR